MTTMRKSIDRRKQKPLEGKLFRGTDRIEVELINHTEHPHQSIYRMVEAVEAFTPEITSGKCTRDVEEVLGGGLQTALESVSYTFGINNISRATTHQLVRSRIGAGFSQQSFRYNRISNFNVRVPESVVQADCYHQFADIVDLSRSLYELMVEKDVPYEDARAICPIGTTTHIIATYTLRALMDLCHQRLCNQVQWEIHEVVNLMAAEVKKVHTYIGEALVCKCDKTKVCMFAGWEDSCGKYPVRNWRSDRR
jgi:thymidylate synthase (FAD)